MASVNNPIVNYFLARELLQKARMAEAPYSRHVRELNDTSNNLKAWFFALRQYFLAKLILREVWREEIKEKLLHMHKPKQVDSRNIESLFREDEYDNEDEDALADYHQQFERYANYLANYQTELEADLEKTKKDLAEANKKIQEHKNIIDNRLELLSNDLLPKLYLTFNLTAAHPHYTQLSPHFNIFARKIFILLADRYGVQNGKVTLAGPVQQLAKEIAPQISSQTLENQIQQNSQILIVAETHRFLTSLKLKPAGNEFLKSSEFLQSDQFNFAKMIDIGNAIHAASLQIIQDKPPAFLAVANHRNEITKLQQTAENLNQAYTEKTNALQSLQTERRHLRNFFTPQLTFTAHKKPEPHNNTYYLTTK